MESGGFGSCWPLMILSISCFLGKAGSGSPEYGLKAPIDRKNVEMYYLKMRNTTCFLYIWEKPTVKIKRKNKAKLILEFNMSNLFLNKNNK